MNMVEKVARALHKDAVGEDRWGELDVHQRKQPQRWARVAIEAMRECTPEMFYAGQRARHQDCLKAWPAMIDEALK